jgi:hypothetical protein
VVLVVFILLLFNLAGWFLWRISLDRLDDQLDRELFDLGRILSVYLDARLTDADDDSAREAALLDLTLYLEQAAGRTPLRRMFLFDRENRIYFDSRDEVEIGQKEPLLEADREQLDRLWAGGEAATTSIPSRRAMPSGPISPLARTHRRLNSGWAWRRARTPLPRWGGFARL